MALQIGDTAPDFEAETTEGTMGDRGELEAVEEAAGYLSFAVSQATDDLFDVDRADVRDVPAGGAQAPDAVGGRAPADRVLLLVPLKKMGRTPHAPKARRA
jgi:hypothetical protein